MPTILGTNNSDLRIGFDGSGDLIYGLDGDDTLAGLGGDDRLDGGLGVDTADYRAAPAAVIVDLAIGRSFGGAGFDALVEIEDIFGSNFSDTLRGDANNNSLHGEAGNDMLFGAAGDDRLVGGAGDDSLDGGPGRDIADYNHSPAGVTVNLESGFATGVGLDRLSGIESVFGTKFADTLTGDANDNLLFGDGSSIESDGGDDRLDGGPGNDILNGGRGFDTADYSRAAAGVVVNMNRAAGAFGGSVTGGAGDDTLIGIDAVIGSAFADSFTGDGLANTLAGGAGDDTLAGGPGNDTLDGGPGFDAADYGGATAGVAVNLAANSAAGGAGSDTLVGFEAIFGSAFADTLTGDANANIIDGQAGNDTLDGGLGFDFASYIAATAGVAVNLAANSATGGAGSDTLVGFEAVFGSAFADTLTGDANVNLMLGGGGNDMIGGGGGNDFLRGDAGNDTLDGGDGSDTALFSGNFADYTIDVVNGAGAVIDKVAGRDGTDTLTFVENLRFADRTVGPATLNNAPVGSVAVDDATPREDRLLTATNAFTDADGLAGAVFSYRWQQSAVGGGAAFTDIAGAANASFTPGQAHVGRYLQVVVSYTDNAGNAESLASAPTAPVANLNDAPVGSVDISDPTPQENQLLTATNAFADEDGLAGAVFSYRWQQSAVGDGAAFTDIAGATNATFTPLAAQGNRQLRVVVTYTDNQGTPETVTSAPTVATTALADIGGVSTGTEGNDILTGTVAANRMFGAAGDDRLEGGGGNDELVGNDGFDVLIGGIGDDILDGASNPEVVDGAGRVTGGQGDIMLGGPGNDTYHVDSPLDFVDEGFVFASAGFGGVDTIESTSDFFWDVYGIGETIMIMEGARDPENDGTTIIGGVLNNVLIGNSGTNVIFGRGGSDTYRAGDGVDFMSLSLLGVPETLYAGVNGVNTVVVEKRASGPFSYDIVFEFESGKDKLNVADYGYASAAAVLALGVNDGLGNSYFVLGDTGLDYLYMVGLTTSQLSVGDFIV